MSTSESHRWRAALAPYQQPNAARSFSELALTATPLAAFWTAGWFAAQHGLFWLALLLSIPAAFFLVRLFMVQHDCGHRAFFKSPLLNDWIGRVIGVLTLTPYDVWRRTHAIHHATSGDLDRRGLGAISMLTVEEYQALSPMRRLGYRAYRHPITLFVLGPFYIFFLQQRVPVGLMREGWRPWASSLGTNAVLALLIGLAIAFGGWRALVWVHIPTMLLAGALGIWLFYVQHQFEDAYWARRAARDEMDAALQGSSHYVLPQPLRWLTANIGVHHVHHASSRIPFYRLPAVLRDFPELAAMGRLTVLESLKCVRLALWDEKMQRMVSFRQLRLADRAAIA